VQKYPHALCIRRVTSSNVTPVVAGGRNLGWHFAPGNGNKLNHCGRARHSGALNSYLPGGNYPVRLVAGKKRTKREIDYSFFFSLSEIVIQRESLCTATALHLSNV
jgi:hypothetical protein